LANHLCSELYIVARERLAAILAPDADNVATLIDPQPLVLRALWVSEIGLEHRLPWARARLNQPDCPLFVFLPSPEGPPYRLGLYFTFSDLLNGIPWWDGKSARHGYSLKRFAVLTTGASSGLLDEARQGRLGYLVTGDAGDTALWRVSRLETDAFGRCVFTLSPIRIAADLPAADFSTLGRQALAAELTQQYNDLCRSAVQHAYRDVVTKARNIVEGVVAARLSSQGHSPSGRLFEDLEQVKRLLGGAVRDACGWRDLEYHLCHRIRLLHGLTHPGSVEQTGALRPELALTVVEDLAFLLTAWGFVGRN
jgi:hypothetical protein